MIDFKPPWKDTLSTKIGDNERRRGWGGGELIRRAGIQTEKLLRIRFKVHQYGRHYGQKRTTFTLLSAHFTNFLTVNSPYNWKLSKFSLLSLSALYSAPREEKWEKKLISLKMACDENLFATRSAKFNLLESEKRTQKYIFFAIHFFE